MNAIVAMLYLSPAGALGLAALALWFFGAAAWLSVIALFLAGIAFGVALVFISLMNVGPRW